MSTEAEGPSENDDPPPELPASLSSDSLPEANLPNLPKPAIPQSVDRT